MLRQESGLDWENELILEMRPVGFARVWKCIDPEDPMSIYKNMPFESRPVGLAKYLRRSIQHSILLHD